MARSYQDKLSADTARANAAGRQARDIADGYPKRCGDKKRRAACERDLRRFFETYEAAAFPLPWSADHLRAIARLQTAVLEGGLFALAMPRGSGKTSMAERAALWALLYGHRRFVVLIGATEADAGRLLEHLKTELLHNDRLAADFRQVCYPIRRLEGNARRCTGQLFDGKPTGIVWSAGRVTFPTMPDDACDGVNVSGATVAVAGLTGAIRGLSHTLPDGEILRPDLVLLDDVQTRESAASVTQTNQRLEIVQGDILGLAGPSVQITALALLTVIEAADLADQILSRERHPEWQGERTQAVYAWPTAAELWQEYHRIRAECRKRGEGTEAAQEFYRQRQQEMDAGAIIAWPERKYPGELSAVQHMENLRADRGEAAFAAEFQNDPQRAAVEVEARLTADDVAGNVNGLARGVVPAGATILTAFADVHDNLLFWCVSAWSPAFTGWVVDYGTWPRQRKRMFTLRNAEPTLADGVAGGNREAAIYAGLQALTAELLGREWRSEAEAVLRIDRMLIDSGYVPDVVSDVCRRSPHAAVLLPSRGQAVGARNRPMHEYTAKPGERHGHNWLIAPSPRGGLKFGRFDAHYWKSFIHNRLALAVGDRESLSLFGADPEEHRLFAQHVVAEAPTLVTANGRTVAEWAPRPGAGDNHWLDCLVGCAVAASMAGAAVEGREPTPAKPKGRKVVSFAELREKARAEQGSGRVLTPAREREYIQEFMGGQR